MHLMVNTEQAEACNGLPINAGSATGTKEGHHE
jgi:hypothetical protein